jgi:phosphatidylglycerol lysyltransferase
MGLSVLKIGEVARVDVPRFTLDGHDMKDFRYAVKRAEREGLDFSIVPAAGVSGIMDELRTVSDAWLEMKSGSEKQFALGNFDPGYLKNFDCAVIRSEGRLVAFANILAGAGREEMSIDLMRHVPKVSNVLMDLLFARLLLHAREEGYRWFNLGATPLTGLADHPLATSWNRIGTMIYQHGEDFFHFEGLRSYKEKFNPVWIPQYLACRGGLSVPSVLFDISALIAGGRMDIIRK